MNVVIIFLNAWFGINYLEGSGRLVLGEVWYLSNHSRIAFLSYVWPSFVTTGSWKGSCVIGQFC